MKKVASFVNFRVKDNVVDKTELVNNYCNRKGYTVCESVTVVGNRTTTASELIKFLKSVKEKGIETVVITSTSERIALEPNEWTEIKSIIDESGITIEMLCCYGFSFLATEKAEKANK